MSGISFRFGICNYGSCLFFFTKKSNFAKIVSCTGNIILRHGDWSRLLQTQSVFALRISKLKHKNKGISKNTQSDGLSTQGAYHFFPRCLLAWVSAKLRFIYWTKKVACSKIRQFCLINAQVIMKCENTQSKNMHKEWNSWQNI